MRYFDAVIFIGNIDDIVYVRAALPLRFFAAATFSLAAVTLRFTLYAYISAMSHYYAIAFAAIFSPP